MGIQLGIRRDATGNIAINRPTGNIEEALHVDGAIQLGQDFGGGNALKMRRNPGTGAFEVDTGAGYGPVGGGVEPMLPNTDYSPVGLYPFNGDILDDSGGGRDFAVAAGTIQECDGIVPGTKGLYCNGGLRIENADAAFQILGDITIGFGYAPVRVAGIGSIQAAVVCDGGTGLEADNALWGVYPGDGVVTIFSEFGAGGPSIWTPPDFRFGIGRWVYYHFRRESDVWSMFMNGQLMGSSGALTTPTGGTASRLCVGQSPNGAEPMIGCLSALKICASALTNSQIQGEAFRVLGLSI